MSASSSTIRMSCAMGYRAQLGGFGGRADGRMRLAGKNQRDPSSARFPILQQQFPLVIFHDLLDDSEPQAGALRAGRHVRLGQALAVLARQAFSVVLDRDRDAAFDVTHSDRDPARRLEVTLDDSHLDRIDGVLYDNDLSLADASTA